MGNKNLVLIINAHQGYIRNINEEIDFSAQNEPFFSAITDTYIPLLNLFKKLELENIKYKVGLVLSSTLCSMLDDEIIKEQYVDWLEKSIKLGESEIKRCKKNGLLENAKRCMEKFVQTKKDFTETYGCNLLESFKYYNQKGFVELIPTAATYAYLPHYQDLTEALNAQVETGLYSQKHYFNETGEGFYLPYLGWAKGIEKILKPYGINYTVADARSILFSKKRVDTGIFCPVRCNNSLVVFAADPEVSKELTGEDAYFHNSKYLSYLNDIGFELTNEELSVLGKNTARRPTGYKYWCNVEDEYDFEDAEVYNEKEALEQVKKDAEDFVNAKIAKLNAAEKHLNGEKGVLVCPIPAELLGQTWHEGLLFLEEVIRKVNASSEGIELELCSNLIENQYSLPKTEPYPCSGDDSGYGEELLDNTNSWMMRYIRKATERMIDLTERLPSETSLKGRLLNLAAKEVLLAESGEWPMMLHKGQLPDYVCNIFKTEILSFTTIFDALASNTVSTEWLTKKEKEDSLYPWMNYRIFSRKK